MNISYEVVRSPRRKKLSITVERDRSIIVHAPNEATDASIRQAVESKRQWLFEKVNHVQKYQDRPHAPGKEIANGESILYLGSTYQIELVKDKFSGIQLLDKLLLPAAYQSNGGVFLRKWYLKEANAKILPRVIKHAKELGVTFSDAKIVDNSYRWGSCTTKDNVTFNWRLIKAPMFVVDYIIIHELAHLLETNHTPRFWNIVRAKSPKAEKAKTWLKEHGHLLEEEI
ncbi:MAG: SprT family zinc-dependent metalloprotease [Verrucomicrobia bacterium]|nr:SprT family zinc-dependent metalloprotease [Verrucomicrobiota bacterium]